VIVTSWNSPLALLAGYWAYTSEYKDLVGDLPILITPTITPTTTIT
jgi:hypothetical protein